MQYYIVRYLHGLQKIRKWLPLIVLPVIVYMLNAASVPDRFSVIQKIAVQRTAPISLSRTPVDCLPMSEVIQNPAELFLDEFSLMELSRRIPKEVRAPGESEGIQGVKGLIEAGMTLKSEGSDQVLLEYSGPNREQGKFFVMYYSQRLVARSKDGIVRTLRMQNRTPGTETAAMTAAAPLGEMQIEAKRSLWRSNRLLPATAILLLSFLCWCIAAGIVEWMDPSFYSERQVSRYLNIPVIGVIPNLCPLAQRLESRKEG